ncbi:MAG: deferrochelatase/peroxidase EfeB [Acidimicrobiaceae bacterium]|jgi:Dyp-type peroxidase family
MARAKGVLPDAVIRDYRASGTFVFANIRPTVADAAAAKSWLVQLTDAVMALCAAVDGEPVARVAVGFGSTFFTRFALALPTGLAAPPNVPNPVAFDIGLYVMSRSDAATADFLRAVAESGALADVTIERGYQRHDGRELSGFRDGLRNIERARRPEFVFVDVERFPEEPDYADNGTYLAYMKVRQNLAAFLLLPVDQQEAIIGRRKNDGSRLDLPSGTNPHAEPEFGDPNLPPASCHIRKTGPRGDHHDDVEIFRRGVPFLTVNADGTLYAGLQFASFQASLEYLDVILNRWMMNTGFPAAGTGFDRLVDPAQAFATIEKTSLFFVPPSLPNRPIGEVMFDPPHAHHIPKLGRVALRKRVQNPDNTPSLGELGGFGFRLFDAAGQPVCGEFFTNSAGHGLSTPVPTQQPLTLRETTVLPNINPAAEQIVTLTTRSTRVDVLNAAPPNTPGYS